MQKRNHRGPGTGYSSTVYFQNREAYRFQMELRRDGLKKNAENEIRHRQNLAKKNAN